MNEPSIAALHPEERTRCEVWTRVMGYHRPVSAFNLGKRSEHQDRCYYSENPSGTAPRRPLPSLALSPFQRAAA